MTGKRKFSDEEFDDIGFEDDDIEIINADTDNDDTESEEQEINGEHNAGKHHNRKWLPVLLCVIVAAVCLLLYRIIPSNKKVNLTDYYGTVDNEAAIVYDHVLTDYKGIVAEGHYYIPADVVKELFTDKLYEDRDTDMVFAANSERCAPSVPTFSCSTYALASQMVAGTGKMQQETKTHPGAMKDAVCSPGGTTIVGVAELERKGFRSAVIDAIDAVMKK